jgi:transglutaminase-like putative cysteine protease
MNTTLALRTRLTLPNACQVVLQVAVAGPTLHEALTMSVDGAALAVEELVDARGSRHHVCHPGPGVLEITYAATVTEQPAVPDLGEMDRLEMLRPSRYCPSDSLVDLARGELAGAAPGEVEQWVHERLVYELGVSLPTEDATGTLARGSGACRDFAHVTTALLRAMEVPARCVGVWAPGLRPMDLHLVSEAWYDGAWSIHDATRLAPVADMVRNGTGRDAADTAWLTTIGSDSDVEWMEVRAELAAQGT